MQLGGIRSAAAIRRSNSFAVVRAIHALGSASRRELATTTGLSFATVATICNELLESGLVTEVARTRAMSGRPTSQLALNGDHGRLLGIDVAETYIEVSVFDAALEMLSVKRCDLDAERREPEVFVATIVEALTETLSEQSRPILGIGASVPGQVLDDDGSSIYVPNWGWHDVPLLELLKEHVDVAILLDNPLKSLVVGELWLHPERASQAFAVINLGTGVGAGISIDGSVMRGRTNSAGEWGHTTLVADGRPCRCGATGCVEAYIGAPGIVQTLRDVAPDSAMLDGDDQVRTITALADNARRGDHVAVEVIERTARYAGLGLGSLVNVLNPDVLVLRGWVADLLDDELARRLDPHIREQSLGLPYGIVRLESPTSSVNSVSLGIAAVALEAHLDTLGAPDGDGFAAPSARRRLGARASGTRA